MSVARETLRLELPFPPPQLSPNARVNWREKAAVTASYREACGWVGIAERKKAYLWAGFDGPVRARVTFVVPNRRKRDTDNLLAMLKPAWDGLVDAGALAGDDSTVFSVESAEVVHVWKRRSPAPSPCVIVELRSG